MEASSKRASKPYVDVDRSEGRQPFRTPSLGRTFFPGVRPLLLMYIPNNFRKRHTLLKDQGIQ